ncbi:MAG: FHA domain-containing protein [Desulfobacterales bacterium]|nr:FHA domain-containing protein [Desulfobacterales bacterium]
MARQSTTILTILFADIADSTRLYSKLGDDKARKIVARCISRMNRIIANYQGHIIKTIGDEVMCIFDDADKAAGAAIRMQEDISGRADWGEVNLSIRVGFHHGKVIREAGDVFGDAVNIAARVVSHTKSGQILTTLESLDTMDSADLMETRFVDHILFKGKDAPMEIHELIWGRLEDMTMVGTKSDFVVTPERTGSDELKVWFQNQSVELGQSLSDLTMGRGPTNRFVVSDPRASRLHARIEYRRGKFILIDHSTNGTHVSPVHGKKAVLRRDEMTLRGEGAIGLGRELSLGAPMAVHYSLRSPFGASRPPR